MVKPATKKAKKKREPEPETGIVIEVGWQYDGGVYGLDPLSEDRIREKYPDALINPGILFGYDETEDYNRFHRPYWETLAQIITGLTPEEMATLGEVTIYDMDNGKVIWRWKPKALKRR
jgi:hypothetical protein